MVLTRAKSACTTRTLHAASTQWSRSVHAVSTHLTRKHTKMRVITRMLLHAVNVKLGVKVQLELINCVYSNENYKLKVRVM